MAPEQKQTGKEETEKSGGSKVREEGKSMCDCYLMVFRVREDVLITIFFLKEEKKTGKGGEPDGK